MTMTMVPIIISPQVKAILKAAEALAQLEAERMKVGQHRHHETLLLKYG
jgi:hypothetical protein